MGELVTANARRSVVVAFAIGVAVACGVDASGTASSPGPTPAAPSSSTSSSSSTSTSSSGDVPIDSGEDVVDATGEIDGASDAAKDVEPDVICKLPGKPCTTSSECCLGHECVAENAMDPVKLCAE